jgi:superfamily II DNA/RNA helicase
VAYGGAPKDEQLQELRKQPHLLIATPGRLNSFLEENAISLQDCRFVYLDEVDRMLDMGFEPQIRKIIARLPYIRQTMIFTATWPKKVMELAYDLIFEPIVLRVGDADALQADGDIEHKVEMCTDYQAKESALIRYIDNYQHQIIVFVATKKRCESVVQLLHQRARVESIHGDRDQQSREKALAAFKSGQVKVLVATDMAVRGVNLKTVRLVIHYDPANNAENHMYRISRTAREGMTATSVSLLVRMEAKGAAQIVEIMKKSNKQVSPQLQEIANRARDSRQVRQRFREEVQRRRHG